MNNKPVQPHGGPVPERLPLPPTNRAILHEAVRSQSRVVTRLPLLIVVVPILVLVFLVAWSIFFPGFTTPVSLERKSASGLSRLMRKTSVDPTTAPLLASSEARNAKGREFWQALCLIHGRDDPIAHKLVSLHAIDDVKASYVYEDARPIELQPENCSFTGPRAGDLANLLEGERCVLVTFNARNWNNYPDKGVIVIWSDKEKAEWLEFDDAADDWGITAEEWADPAGKLFGKKAPFQHTYE